MSGEAGPIRILSVDDHQLIRVGIATLLQPEADMKLVCEANNGRDAIAKFRDHVMARRRIQHAISRRIPSTPACCVYVA